MADAPRVPPARGRLRRGLTVAGVALFLILCVPVGVGWYLLYAPASRVPADERVSIEVPSGSTTAGIARILAGSGVVANANMFRIQTRLAGADGKLKAGRYDLYTGMPYEEVIDRLRKGPPIEYATVTIPEGFTIDQIADRLQAQAGVSADDFRELATHGADRFHRFYLDEVTTGSLEGYLFPKTYRLRRGATATEAVNMMLDQFEKEVAALDLDYARAKGRSLHDVVIIASMIEREARLPKERSLVSSVIHNRLERGMYLEIDATIEYVLPGNRFRLRSKDLRIDSPYNTYRVRGLPAGPIANPGMASLRAAAAPASTGYIYYVLTGRDGSHTFCENASEFAAAKRRSKEVFGK
ncbi:MAG: endolytic transglycosylase MltG [Coriobacteriaceae bacterium]|nr:endolytic transglycosylase MltG [Coriobacteriaceae bacterium]